MDLAIDKSDIVWTLACGILVFLMQSGFLCLEVGAVRPKAATITALKNLVDWVVCVLCFFLFGWGLMFGHSAFGLFGTDGFMLHLTADALKQGNALGLTTHFLFEAVFAGTAATIVSGALAERTSFYAYMLFTVVISAVIYPIVGHWCWGNSFFAIKGQAFLASMGFIDFAGSTVVHSVGGWCALVGIIITGARLGRFGKNGEVSKWENTGLHYSALGVLLLWTGWWGFNGGSTLRLSADVGSIIINTNIAGACGGLGAILYRHFFKRSKGISFAFLNGIIGGLVGITASCFMTTPTNAMLIGFTSGVISTMGLDLLTALRLDDPVGAVPTHLFCGIWGTLCVALFGKQEIILQHAGSRLSQLGVQAFGIIVVAVWCLGLSLITFWIIKRFIGLRVSPQEEIYGYDMEGAYQPKTEDAGLTADELKSLFLAEQNSHKE